MSVTHVDKDDDSRTLTLIADFDAPAEQVWQLWADPRQLERWWGPPSYPATVEHHDLTPGGSVTYFLTAPTGRRRRCWWHVTAVTPPISLEFTEGFADRDGTPVAGPATTVRVHLTDHRGGTRMELRATFESPEHMERMLNLGKSEGLQQAVAQMDTVLAR